MTLGSVRINTEYPSQEIKGLRNTRRKRCRLEVGMPLGSGRRTWVMGRSILAPAELDNTKMARVNMPKEVTELTGPAEVSHLWLLLSGLW